MGAENIIDMLSKIEKDRKPEKTERKRKAPEKPCPECDSQCHARASTCKDCGYEFYEKKRAKQERLAENWKDLKAGDIIKVVSGSGPYYLSKDKPGEKIMMGQKGKFEVIEVRNGGPKCCGINAHQLYGRSGKSNYREWIYMGESYYKEDVSIHKEPHRIKVLKSCQAT